MLGVKFNNEHSYNDLSLVLSSKVIGVPKVKVYKVSVPGSNGDLDFTEFFGDIKYENLELEFVFSFVGSNPMQKLNEIRSKIHGRKYEIVLDDDPNYKYIGRVHADSQLLEPCFGQLKIMCDCEPYKYKIANTVVNKTLESTPLSVTLVNSRMPVIPTLTTSGSIQITYGTKVLNFSAGTYKATDLLLLEGNNDMTISGPSGTTVKFEYLEGVL